MDDQFRSIVSIALVPPTVSLIANKEDIDEITALQRFYRSTTYAMLSREETKLWHYSPLTLYGIWKREVETGEMVYPEG